MFDYVRSSSWIFCFVLLLSPLTWIHLGSYHTCPLLSLQVSSLCINTHRCSVCGTCKPSQSALTCVSHQQGYIILFIVSIFKGLISSWKWQHLSLYYSLQAPVSYASVILHCFCNLIMRQASIKALVGISNI